MTTKADALEALEQLRNIPIEYLPDGAVNRLDKFINSVPEWQPIETAPVDVPFIATILVRNNKTGEEHYDTHVICIDYETGDLVEDFGWRLEDYSHWMPLPNPTITGEK